jgi:hypothetical protein
MYPILDIVIVDAVLSTYGSWPTQIQGPPPPHTCEISHLHPLPTPDTPLHTHVYLIDKFSLYNLKMANICGRNM